MTGKVEHWHRLICAQWSIEQVTLTSIAYCVVTPKWKMTVIKLTREINISNLHCCHKKASSRKMLVTHITKVTGK